MISFEDQLPEEYNEPKSTKPLASSFFQAIAALLAERKRLEKVGKECKILTPKRNVTSYLYRTGNFEEQDDLKLLNTFFQTVIKKCRVEKIVIIVESSQTVRNFTQLAISRLVFVPSFGKEYKSINVKWNVLVNRSFIDNIQQKFIKLEKQDYMSPNIIARKASSIFSEWAGEKYVEKVYQCAIDADFPDNEVDKKYLKERVTKLVLESTQSTVDLDFVKELILVEHTQEIASLEFEELNLKQLPWSSLVFGILDIKKGSTIIKFHLGFHEPPQNESDLNTYRLIELVVITIIENLQFIKSIKEFKTDRNNENLILSAKVEAHLFDESVIKETISSLRGSLSFIVSETDPADDQVETFLLDLFEQKPDEFMKLTNLNLTPVSMRRIINVLKDSKLTDKDVANVTIELDTSIKKNKCALVKADSSFLFPYNFRKLADLEPQVFKLMLKSTRDLPKEKELWYKFFLYNLDMFEVGDIRKLSKEVDADWPYPDILDEYKEHGGTLGGLVQALEKFEEEVDGGKEKQNIAKFLETIKNLREEVYEHLLENVFCPSQCPSVQNFEDFQKMARHQGLKIKTNPMQSFKTLQRFLIPGDQLWIFHARPQMRTYAHVVIITEALKFIHVTAPKRLHLKLILRSKIKEENQHQLLDEKFCFIVRPVFPIEGDPDMFSKRALCCCGILFDYDPETANCETFCNGVHGIWKPSVQGQDLRGVAQNAANAFSKLVIKRRNEALTSQMQRRFLEQQMILPNEIFK